MLPFILAVALIGGTGSGVTSFVSARDEIMAADKVQQHFLQLKRAAIARVAAKALAQH